MVSNPLDISVIILTKDEALHLRRCLNNLSPIVRQIIVIDSGSTDETVEIAKSFGAEVYFNTWVNYATQFNWALNHATISGTWVLRMDADEYLSERLKTELIENLPIIPQGITGIVLPLRRFFLGRYIKSSDGIKMLRLFKREAGYCENRFMDEHISLSHGTTREFHNWFADDNLNDLSWWTNKHIGYAIREAADLLNLEYGSSPSDKNHDYLEQQAAQKREKKGRYMKLPLFWRSFYYFLYRYFFKLGFLDGKEGFLWHFLQGWWYRTLVDAKIFEIRKSCGSDIVKIRILLREKYNIILPE